MKSLKVVIALFVFMFSSFAWPQATRLNAVEDYKDDSWGLTFGAAYTSRVLVHNESSTVPDYTSTGRRIRVPDVQLSFSLFKEFLNTSRISFTAMVMGGIADSSGKSGGENLEDLEEKLTGQHFGGGLTVNYNIFAYGLKLQPYVGGRFLSEQGELMLTHTSGGTVLNTIHEYDAQLMHFGLGIRAFDADYNLMSYFEVSLPNVMSESYTPIGRVSGADIDITSDTEITREAWAFSMGFGYYF